VFLVKPSKTFAKDHPLIDGNLMMAENSCYTISKSVFYCISNYSWKASNVLRQALHPSLRGAQKVRSLTFDVCLAPGRPWCTWSR